MSYTVKPFYLDADGEEFPWAEPFAIPSAELDAYKREPKQKLADMRRPAAPPDGPRPDGLRIEDEEGAVVFRYPGAATRAAD